MKRHLTMPGHADERRHSRLRHAVVAMLVLAVTAAHWWTPQGEVSLHAVHILLRKLYLLPVVLAAIWFGLRAALLTAAVITILYAPHVILQWGGQRGENVNQVGEAITIWLTAVIAGLFADAEKRVLARLTRAYEGVVNALVAALDMREHDTEVHSLRVRAYTLRLAEELRVEPGRRRVFALAALLHDIGKIGVSDSILLKQGKLTEEEWSQMRRHPEFGRRILAPVPFLREAQRIVYAHHERYDGSGYPTGLSGSSIPWGARIFAVADVFDALTSARPYKDTMTYSQARTEIEAGRGSHFDPDVVDAFLRVAPAEWEAIRTAVARSDGQAESATEELLKETP
ncbi:MAG: HD domain-containing protein [Phycisphaerales bacterium]|nr:MAG: HD domain-containing protein [Phycisphaerales bacterium]